MTALNSDCVRRRGAAMTYLSHSASFHSNERITPSNLGIKHLGATASQTAGRTDATEIELIAQGAESYPGPVLLLAGTCNDWLGEDVQRVHLSFFSNGELSIVPNSGHDLIWDNPDETMPLIRAFLGK